MSGRMTRTLPGAICSCGSSSWNKRTISYFKVWNQVKIHWQKQKSNISYIFGEEFVDPVVRASVRVLTKDCNGVVLFFPLLGNIATVDVGASTAQQKTVYNENVFRHFVSNAITCKIYMEYIKSQLVILNYVTKDTTQVGWDIF